MIRTADIPDVKQMVRSSIDKEPGFSLEYFEVVDDTSLVPVNSKEEMKSDATYFGCIALKAGTIRLIDNIEFGLV